MSGIAVVDYGMGNLRSVSRALEHVTRQPVTVARDPDTVRRADRVVFPGVGAIRDCMTELRRLDLMAPVMEAARTRPFLGICLGMQALLEFNEENQGVAGLGVLPGVVRRFREPLADAAGHRLKVPHMGWNQVYPTGAHPLWDGMPAGTRFYFVHSYYVEPGAPALTAATADYPGPFTAALARGNLFAVQFHPEKSQDAGLALLERFTAWDGGGPADRPHGGES